MREESEQKPAIEYRMQEEAEQKPAVEYQTREETEQRAAIYVKWAGECADRSVTLVKDRKGILPIRPERYHQIRLISLGEDRLPEGSLREITKRELERRGFSAEFYDPQKDSVNGTGSLDPGILDIYLCNLGVRSIDRCRKGSRDCGGCSGRRGGFLLLQDVA